MFSNIKFQVYTFSSFYAVHPDIKINEYKENSIETWTSVYCIDNPNTLGEDHQSECETYSVWFHTIYLFTLDFSFFLA